MVSNQATDIWAAVEAEFIHFWGCSKKITLPFPSSYYESELGAITEKHFLIGATQISASQLCEVKRWSEVWESTHYNADTGSRAINIDPGGISTMHLVLTTFKNFSHRAALGSGVYWDLQLVRSKGVWTILPWTYVDYQNLADLLNNN
jgi:hypothetical protein